MTTQDTTIREEMKAAVRYAGETIYGDRGRIEEIADEWLDEDFTVSEAEEYWKAVVFTPSAAAELRDAGIEASDERLSQPYDDTMNYGYAFANGDVSLKDIRKLSPECCENCGADLVSDLATSCESCGLCGGCCECNGE